MRLFLSVVAIAFASTVLASLRPTPTRFQNTDHVSTMIGTVPMVMYALGDTAHLPPLSVRSTFRFMAELRCQLVLPFTFHRTHA